MDSDLSLRITHDVSQTLQRKLEGLADVERAFVHVDYDAEHDIGEEHKPLYEEKEAKPPISARIKERINRLSWRSKDEDSDEITEAGGVVQ
jgi:hypothetical protein